MSQHTEDGTVTVLATFGHGEICSSETYTNPPNSNRTIVHIVEAGCPGYTTQIYLFEILFKSARIHLKHRLWLENPSIFKTCIETWVNTGISILFPSLGRHVNLRITLPGMETTSMKGDPLAYFPPGGGGGGIVGSSGIWNIDDIPMGITNFMDKRETTIGNIISKFSGSIYPTSVEIEKAIISVKLGIDRMRADLDDRMKLVKPIDLYKDFELDDAQLDILSSYINIKYPTNYDTIRLPNRSVTYQLVCRGEAINLRTPETPEKLKLLRSRSDNKADAIGIYAQSVLSESPMLSDMLRYIPEDQLHELKETFSKIKLFLERKVLDKEDTRILEENFEARAIPNMATATGLEEEMKQLKPFSEEPGTSKGGMRRKTRTRTKKSKRRLRKFYSKKRKS